MKILFAIQDREMPSSRVRVLNLLPELERHGLAVSWVKYPKGLRDKLALFRRCRQADLVVLQKKLPTPVEARLLRAVSRRLVFDFDDAIYLRHDAQGNLDSRSRSVKFSQLLRRVDLVLAGNRVLAEKARPYAARVVVVPSAVETRMISVNRHEQDATPLVIGWVGGSVNLHHLETLTPVLRRLAERFAIQVRILCDRGIEVPGVETRLVHWQLETQEAEIARFDLGVMPLPSNQHTEGKCGYKALQYMAAAVPPVVSDVGVNGEIVEHGRTGFVARTDAEFFQGLEALLQSRGLRREMGQRARERAERCYSVETVGRQVAEVLRGLTKLRLQPATDSG